MWRRLSPSCSSSSALLVATTRRRTHPTLAHLYAASSSRRASASSSSSSSGPAALAATGPEATATVVPKSGLRNTLGLCAELSKARLRYGRRTPHPVHSSPQHAPHPRPPQPKTKSNSALVVMTTSAGFLAAGGPVAWVPLASVCVGTMLAASSANTWNQLIETENDRRMKRTFLRPLPSGRASKQFAVGWGLTSAGASAAILGLGTNPLTAALGMGNLALYALPYTLSKTRSEVNTWIGAVVGAVPPMMGWAAATNCSLEALVTSPEAMLLASTLFLWQFPHFFALSWVHRKDYARGGFQMIPCQDPGGVRTASLIMRYSAYMAPLPLLATGLGVTGSMFALEGTVLNAYLLYLANKFNGSRTDENARAVFRCSLWYLPVLLGGFVFHSKHWNAHKETLKEGEEETEVAMNLVARARRQLAKVCMHEVLLQDNKTKGGGVLCPPVVASHVVEETKEVVGKAAEEAAAVGGVRVTLSTRGGDKE